MPIIGGSPKECFDTFGDHVKKLIADTLPTSSIVELRRSAKGDDWRTLVLANPNLDDIVPLKSSTYGRIHVSFAQNLCARARADRRYELHTCAYWYRVIQDAPSLTTEALFRWEYEADPPQGKEWCKQHFQVGRVGPGGQALTVPLSKGSVDLNRLHMPTGYVLIEYVIRFLIVELGVKPRCGDKWPAVLKGSEDKFFREFSSPATDVFPR